MMSEMLELSENPNLACHCGRASSLIGNKVAVIHRLRLIPYIVPQSVERA
jgi:hypothetical protein